jgi:MFS-type transporter involved in bile tolerance (Atg22 family)
MTAEVMLTTVIALLVGFLGMGFTNYLKTKLGWEDKAAVALTAIVALGFAFLQLFFTNQIAPEMFTVENFPGTFGLVFSFATLYYKLLAKKPNNVG